MARVAKIDKKLNRYLLETGYHRWSQIDAIVKRTWILTSTIAESINNATMRARELPVAKLLNFMRKLVEIWNAKHNEEANNTFTDLTKKYQENIKDNRVRASIEFLHTVIDGSKRFRVCLQARTCSCGRFQLDEIPFKPFPCESTWNLPINVKEEIVLPPDYKRPATKRMKSFYEGKFKKSTMTCSRCSIEGHNTKTCSNIPQGN
ncbi:uncharacterized protein LOC132616414 [Lycium barbarum]|uniref:uncharacterized protein LOC132616414 n=1 Tax=Lycium barbarum TaxID=112863 RepID=UPI00293E7837|nr:uncharacterized protein LOC132616414 [Lycium barbarum]